jgi:hypothetical protein
LKIKQNQTVYICDRKLHHKPFLLSVENEFYTFRVRNNRGSRLGLHTKPVTFFSNIKSYSLRSKSYNSVLFLEEFYKVWRKLCSTEYIQNVYSSFRHMLTFYIWLLLASMLQATVLNYQHSVDFRQMTPHTVLFLNSLWMHPLKLKNKIVVYLPKTNRKLLRN